MVVRHGQAGGVSPGRPGGFTLVELLVVVAIIGLLVGIAIPALMKALIAAKKAAMQAQVTSLAAACDVYQMQLGSYPGVFRQWGAGGSTGRDRDSGLITGSTLSQISATESLVLALMGGITPVSDTNQDRGIDISGTTAAASPNYAPLAVGQGPYDGPATGPLKKLDAFFSLQDRGVSLTDFDGNGFYEFGDGGSTSMPILYYRASPGKPGVVNRDTSAAGAISRQYNMAFNEKYFDPAKYRLPRPTTEAGMKNGPDGGVDPERSAVQHAFNSSANGQANWANFVTSINDVPASVTTFNVTTGWSTIAQAAAATNARPVNPDRFLIMGAGPDGVFGPVLSTANGKATLEELRACDDVTNWKR